MSSPGNSRTTPAEWLLARLTTPDRAAAILGDLTEMAAARGRLWFVAAYARTLVALTWRIVLALFVADIGRELMFNLANLYFHATPQTWRTSNAPHLLNSMGPLLACIMSTLWFVLPFAAVRYGVRDRFVRLTFAIAVGTTIAFLFIPYASLLLATATLALAAAALLFKAWRKPLEVLLATGITGIVTLALINGLRLHQRPHAAGARTLSDYVSALSFDASLLVLALVCSRLHRRLLDGPPSANATAE